MSSFSVMSADISSCRKPASTRGFAKALCPPYRPLGADIGRSVRKVRMEHRPRHGHDDGPRPAISWSWHPSVNSASTGVSITASTQAPRSQAIYPAAVGMPRTWTKLRDLVEIVAPGWRPLAQPSTLFRQRVRLKLATEPSRATESHQHRHASSTPVCLVSSTLGLSTWATSLTIQTRSWRTCDGQSSCFVPTTS